MPSSEIQLLLRDDYATKSGGDLVLARHYESALNAAGHTARLEALSRQAIEGGSGVAQLFNVDRYFEFTAAAEALAGAGRPYVVAPIHHPLQDVAYFEAHVRTGMVKRISQLGRGPFGREGLKHVIRGRSARSLREVLRSDPRAAAARALQQAALVVVQAPSELDEIESTFGVDVRSKSAWVPNGVAVDDAVDTDATRDIDILVGGRIEERKNQLGIARALAGTPWTVTFVGGDSATTPSYAAEFHRFVDQHDNLRSIAHVSLDELRRLYSRSKVFLSASFIEVVSLTELEAVAYGCRLVSTTSGYLRDYLGDLATYVDPKAGAEPLRAALTVALGQGLHRDGMAHVRSNYSWAISDQRLVEAFERAGLGA